eukprot:1731590-Prymnesium_polylepis.1
MVQNTRKRCNHRPQSRAAHLVFRWRTCFIELNGARIDTREHTRDAIALKRRAQHLREKRVAVRHVGKPLLEGSEHLAESEQTTIDGRALLLGCKVKALRSGEVDERDGRCFRAQHHLRRV